jgi:hypothetical protein
MEWMEGLGPLLKVGFAIIAVLVRCLLHDCFSTKIRMRSSANLMLGVNEIGAEHWVGGILEFAHSGISKTDTR